VAVDPQAGFASAAGNLRITLLQCCDRFSLVDGQFRNSNWYEYWGAIMQNLPVGQPGPAQAGGTAVIHAIANTPIKVMHGGSPDVVDSYNAYISVERL